MPRPIEQLQAADRHYVAGHGRLRQAEKSSDPERVCEVIDEQRLLLNEAMRVSLRVEERIGMAIEDVGPYLHRHEQTGDDPLGVFHYVRPADLTPEVQARVCEAVRAGNALEVAAAYAGVTTAILVDWAARGREEIERIEKAPGRRRTRSGEQRFVRFFEAVAAACADLETRNREIRDRLERSRSTSTGPHAPSAWPPLS